MEDAWEDEERNTSCPHLCYHLEVVSNLSKGVTSVSLLILSPTGWQKVIFFPFPTPACERMTVDRMLDPQFPFVGADKKIPKMKRRSKGKGSNPRPWKRRQVPKFLTTGLGFGNLSTALGYNLGRSSSCQCLFSFSFEDDLITKIGRLLTAPEFYSFFLWFGAVTIFSCLHLRAWPLLLSARARGGEEETGRREDWSLRKSSAAVLFLFLLARALREGREEGNRRRAKEPVTCHLLSLSLERLPVPRSMTVSFARARKKRPTAALGKGKDNCLDAAVVQVSKPVWNSRH